MTLTTPEEPDPPTLSAAASAGWRSVPRFVAAAAWRGWSLPEAVVLAAAIATAALAVLGPQITLESECPRCTLLLHLTRGA